MEWAMEVQTVIYTGYGKLLDIILDSYADSGAIIVSVRMLK